MHELPFGQWAAIASAMNILDLSAFPIRNCREPRQFDFSRLTSTESRFTRV
jgi:hypothetical protein